RVLRSTLGRGLACLNADKRSRPLHVCAELHRGGPSGAGYSGGGGPSVALGQVEKGRAVIRGLGLRGHVAETVESENDRRRGRLRIRHFKPYLFGQRQAVDG